MCECVRQRRCGDLAAEFGWVRELGEDDFMCPSTQLAESDFEFKDKLKAIVEANADAMAILGLINHPAVLSQPELQDIVLALGKIIQADLKSDKVWVHPVIHCWHLRNDYRPWTRSVISGENRLRLRSHVDESCSRMELQALFNTYCGLLHSRRDLYERVAVNAFRCRWGFASERIKDVDEDQVNNPSRYEWGQYSQSMIDADEKDVAILDFLESESGGKRMFSLLRQEAVDSVKELFPTLVTDPKSFLFAAPVHTNWCWRAKIPQQTAKHRLSSFWNGSSWTGLEVSLEQ